MYFGRIFVAIVLRRMAARVVVGSLIVRCALAPVSAMHSIARACRNILKGSSQPADLATLDALSDHSGQSSHRGSSMVERLTAERLCFFKAEGYYTSCPSPDL